MEKLTKIGNTLTKGLTTILAVLFMFYGLLMLWDMYRTEIRAFASYDLLQYRPNVEENEPPYLDDLILINPDTRAWLTIYGTNIDYPVMQGKDDMEYLNKDVYGKFSITGSIYESYKYPKDFSAPYTLIYGHHMANGSMFGDIEKFLNKSFFDKNEDGILILPNMAYNLKIIAVLETDAYDIDIYEDYSGECLSRAKYKRNINADKIIALSTCDERSTNARIVLLCSATIRTDPVPSHEKGEATQREAVGHPMSGAYWGLLNLIALLISIYAVIRDMFLEGTKKQKIIEIMLLGISTCLFFLTEDMHKPIQIVDAFTLPMIIVLALIWFVSRQPIKRSNKGDEKKDI